MIRGRSCAYTAALILICVGCYSVSSFVTFHLTSTARSKSCLSVSNNGREETLYDILGASPNDSQRVLKTRYTELAKLTHPDASNGGDSDRFRKIAAAWSVLGDPKERLRYDRNRKAKEFTSNMESLLDVGFKNAVPFIKKTADTTIAAVETSSRTVKGVSTQLGRAKDRFDLDQKCRDLEQQASSQFALAKKFKSQSENINDKRHKTLSSPDSVITAVEARRLLDGFVSTERKISVKSKPQGPANKDIRYLDKVESDFTAKQAKLQDAERQVAKAQKNEEAAQKAQAAAQERLRQAEKELAQATKATESCQTTHQKAVSLQEKFSLEVDKANGVLEKQQEKVRAGLIKKESETLQSEAEHLKKKSEVVEKKAKELENQAQEMRIQSEKMHAEHRKLQQKERGNATT